MQAASKSETSGKSARNATRKKAKKSNPLDCRHLSHEQICDIIREHQATKPPSQLEMVKNYQIVIQTALLEGASYSDICEILAKRFKFNANRSTLSTYVKQSMPDLVRPSRKKGSAGSTNDRKAPKSAVAVPIPPAPDDFEQVGRSTEQGEIGPALPLTLRTTEVTTEKLPSPSSTSKPKLKPMPKPKPRVSPFEAVVTRKIRKSPG